MRPRVWFGERWITSVFDLFEENVRYFPALLPITDDEDPLAVLEDGGTPGAGRAAAAQRHDLPLEPPGLRRRPTACPHLRVENRVLAAGPTVADTMANAAFYFGLVRGAGREPSGRCGRRCPSAPPRRTSTSPPGTASRPRSTGPASARSAPPSWCCAGCCRWPTRAWRRGAWRPASPTGCSAIIEQRCLLGTNGAEWFVRRMDARRDLDRFDALRATLLEYRELDAHQRAGAHLGLSPAGLTGAAAGARSAGAGAGVAPAVAVDHDQRAASRPASPPAATGRREPGGVDVLEGQPAGPGQPDQRARRGRPVAGRAPQARRGPSTSTRSAWSAARRPHGPHRRDRAGRADVQQRRVGAARRSEGVVEDGAPRRRAAAGDRGWSPSSARCGSLHPARPAARAALVHRWGRRGACGYGAGDWGESMSTVVVGYVPKPEGEAALAKAIEEAELPWPQARGGQHPPRRQEPRRTGATGRG